MRLIPGGEKVRLCDMDPGLFLFDDCIALKTEYISESGRIEAYIVDSGEFFHGGTKTAEGQRCLMVQPLKVVPVVLLEDLAHTIAQAIPTVIENITATLPQVISEIERIRQESKSTTDE